MHAWVVVEKVLADGEPLPPDWQAAGTTGYETLTVINGLLVDPAGEEPLGRLYTELTGDTADFAAVADAGKRLIARRGARDRSVAAGAAARRPARSVALDLENLRDALIEVFCGLDVYRPFATSAVTVAALDEAVRVAVARRPALRDEIDAVRAHALADDEFGVRFGQTRGGVVCEGCRRHRVLPPRALAVAQRGRGRPGQIRLQHRGVPPARGDAAGADTDRDDDALDARHQAR